MNLIVLIKHQIVLLRSIFIVIGLLEGCSQAPPNFYQREDIMELALLIESECSNCGLDEKFMVGSTVINRSKDNNMSVIDVIHEPRQYHGVDNNQWCYNQESWDIAKWLVLGFRKPDSVLYFWRNTQRKPRWVKKETVKMEYHNFGI